MGNLSFYAFYGKLVILCFIMPYLLQKVGHDEAEGILVVSDWPNQLWYTQYTKNDH